MVDETSISNKALRRIGSRPLTLFGTDGTKEDDACATFLTEAVKTTLKLYNWTFATRRSQLTAHGTAPAWGYDYAYLLPTDFIHLITAHPSDNQRSKIRDYLIEMHEDASSADLKQAIYTNTNLCYIRYVAYHVKFDEMSPDFVDLLAFVLARDLAAALSISISEQQISDDIFKRLFTKATSRDAMQQPLEPRPPGSWAQSRSSRGRWSDEIWTD